MAALFCSLQAMIVRVLLAETCLNVLQARGWFCFHFVVMPYVKKSSHISVGRWALHQTIRVFFFFKRFSNVCLSFYMLSSIGDPLVLKTKQLVQKWMSELVCFFYPYTEAESEDELYEVVDITEYARRHQWWSRVFGSNTGPIAEKYSVATQIMMGGVTGW